MIVMETSRGKISITNNYFAKLIGDAASSCYGVAGMVSKGTQKWMEVLRGKGIPEKGIKIKGNSSSISVDLHIIVTYGLNINAIAKSIVHKVKYVVEEATGIKVDKVTVHIDGMKSE